MRVCAQCGAPLPASMRSTAKYCSAACRKAAQRARQSGNGDARPERRARKRPGATVPRLNSREFERMMDGSIEDELRHVRDRLKVYLDDPATPATAMANLAARYVAVCEKLHDMAGGDDLLADLTDEVPEEVAADAGASIV